MILHAGVFMWGRTQVMNLMTFRYRLKESQQDLTLTPKTNVQKPWKTSEKKSVDQFSQFFLIYEIFLIILAKKLFYLFSRMAKKNHPFS